MFETIIITVGIVLSLFAISKANIKITIVHKSEELPKIAPTTEKGMTQEELDTKAEQDQPPTFDDVVAAVHEILGGDVDD